MQELYGCAGPCVVDRPRVTPATTALDAYAALFGDDLDPVAVLDPRVPQPCHDRSSWS
jgi:hypothetical protein